MYEKYGFNPRKCSSASKLSGCIEGYLSKVIITLPTSNEVFEFFEKTLTGGFSCFNTELLLSNVNNMSVDGMIICTNIMIIKFATD